MSDAHELLDDLAGAGRQLREKIPGVYSGYVTMASAAMGEGGELPARMKELIALAIAVTRECDGCIAAHARGAARQGASEQEVAEALGVAILMNGGPGTVWAPRAYAAFREFGAGQWPGWPAGQDSSVVVAVRPASPPRLAAAGTRCLPRRRHRRRFAGLP